MNERIKELYEQSMKVVSYTDGGYTEIKALDAEKFAELIVRECAKISINDEIDPCDDIRTGIANKIKKHFGVEE